jgi:hypothetical protein
VPKPFFATDPRRQTQDFPAAANIRVRLNRSLRSNTATGSADKHIRDEDGGRFGFCSCQFSVDRAARHIDPARFAVGSNAQISGTYWATEYHAKIAVGGGGDLPLTAAGKVCAGQEMA